MNKSLPDQYPDNSVQTAFAAATWVTKFYRGIQSHKLRQHSAIAGKAMTQPDVTETEAIAAWMYRPCEDCVRDATDQECLIQEIGRVCGNEVELILRSLVAPFGSTDRAVWEQFARSSPSAKRIRIAEVLVGLEASYIVLFGGSMAKLNDVQAILKFARFVYENSATEISPSTRKELLTLLVSVENMWQAIVSTTESFENTVSPPDMVPIKILTLTNDLGSIQVGMMNTAANVEAVRRSFDKMRDELGGAQFAETIFHATVPLPKTDILKTPKPLPDPQVTPAS